MMSLWRLFCFNSSISFTEPQNGWIHKCPDKIKLYWKKGGGYNKIPPKLLGELFCIRREVVNDERDLRIFPKPIC